MGTKDEPRRLRVLVCRWCGHPVSADEAVGRFAGIMFRCEYCRIWENQEHLDQVVSWGVIDD